MKPSLAPARCFNAVKVFSGDHRAQVDRLVEAWLEERSIHVIEMIVTESTTTVGSLVCVTVFYDEQAVAAVLPVRVAAGN